MLLKLSPRQHLYSSQQLPNPEQAHTNALELAQQSGNSNNCYSFVSSPKSASIDTSATMQSIPHLPRLTCSMQASTLRGTPIHHTMCHDTCFSPISKLLIACIQRTQVTTSMPRYVTLNHTPSDSTHLHLYINV